MLRELVKSEDTLCTYQREHLDYSKPYTWDKNGDAAEIWGIRPSSDWLWNDVNDLVSMDVLICNDRTDRNRIRRVSEYYTKHYNILQTGYTTPMIYSTSGKTITLCDLCEHEVYIRTCFRSIPDTINMELVRYWRTLQIVVPLLPHDGVTIRDWTSTPSFCTL